MLYVPGANQRALARAETMAADSLILDLEDAVAPEAKVAARERVCAAVAAGAYGAREVTIRVNAMGTQWHDDDVAAVAAAAPAAVVVPKVDSAAAVRAVAAALVAGGAPATTAIWGMLETPTAILQAREIAAASPALTVLVMGCNDLANELRADAGSGRLSLVTSLSLAVLAARAAGVDVLDGVYNDVRDLDGFVAECRQGRQLGFDGKTLIHPSQVDPCNTAFSPTPDDVTRARDVIDAFERARADGRGVVTVDGRMVESLHVEQSRRVLAVLAVLEAIGTVSGRPAGEPG